MGKLGKAFLFLLAVMLLLTAVSRAAASFTVAQVRVEEPQSRKIVHTVTGDGIVEQMTELPVYTAADVLVAEVLVQQGQTVQKGDVLARLDMNSIDEKIQMLEDDIKTLNLQNQAIASQRQQASQNQSKAHRRAQEDYDNTILRNEMEAEEASQKIEDAKLQLEEAQKKAEEQAKQARQEKQEELQQAVNAAQKAYEDAKQLAENELLMARRAVEDASKTPAADYSADILQLQINQKQRALNDLYRQKWEVWWEEQEDLDKQIRSLEDEIAALCLQLSGMENACSKQEEERKQALERAQEDYSNTVKKYDQIVCEAEQDWHDAGQALTDFLESDGGDLSTDPSVKAAEQALANARQQAEELPRQQEQEQLQAKRTLEDSAASGARDTTADINALLLEEKKRQLALLMNEKDNGGTIAAQMDETITKVLLTVGQRTPETAVFLMSDTSGGMLFTTQISKEDSVYVTAEDSVTLRCAGKTCEGLSILSTETNEDESVTINVFVPKDTMALGAYAAMELTKQSEEYSITVPICAVHTENEKNYVFIMQPEDTVLGGQYMAQRVDVTIAEKNGFYAAITESSLTSESQVIVDSDQIISAGEKVRLQEGS